MQCSDIDTCFDLYIDGELAERERAEVESHVDQCGACHERLARRQATKRELRTLSGRFELPRDFQQRLHSSFEAAVRAPAPAPASADRRVWAGAAVAAAAVALAIGAWAGLQTDEAAPASGVLGASQIRMPVVAQSVQWHRRQVPVEVTGPQAEDVQDWFAGKVDFAVQAPDLGSRAQLLGGRLGYLDQTEAAVLVYEVDGQKLSVLIFDADRVASMGELVDVTDGEVYVDNSEGYSVAVQRSHGLGYTYTSNMPEAQLVSLVRGGN